MKSDEDILCMLEQFEGTNSPVFEFEYSLEALEN